MQIPRSPNPTQQKPPPGHASPVLGLTGMIGSGKSAVAEQLRLLGATIIDADVLAREAVAPGSPGLRQVLSAFGRHLLLGDGTLDRKTLGAIVFAQPEKRAALEAIVHPQVRLLFARALAEARQQTPPPPIIVYVVPLLFETAAKHSELDKILLVTAPKQQCLERIMRRDHCDLALASAKYEAQMPEEKKRTLADYIVENDSDLAALGMKVRALWDNLLALRQ